MDACPACGGSGGGPFGPPNSAWDREDFVCTRCGGAGVISVEAEPGPSVAKSTDAPTKEKTGTHNG